MQRTRRRRPRRRPARRAVDMIAAIEDYSKDQPLPLTIGYLEIVSTLPLESSREMASDLLQSYLASTSNRLNHIMKFLTMISTVVLPNGPEVNVNVWRWPAPIRAIPSGTCCTRRPRPSCCAGPTR